MTVGIGNTGAMQTSGVTVQTTNGRGLPVEHWAARCLDRIVHVADDSESPIKAQAMAFKEEIRAVITQYMGNAIKSERTTLYNVLLKAGHPEAAELIRRL
jgi:hypothetical protein